MSRTTSPIAGPFAPVSCRAAVWIVANVFSATISGRFSAFETVPTDAPRALGDVEGGAPPATEGAVRARSA